MINIKIEESLCLDMLSILHVKKDKNPTINNVINYNNFYSQLQREITKVVFDKIIHSREYLSLYEINLVLFELIEGIRNGIMIDAISVDNLNIKRWQIKNVLQKKYFGAEISETKTNIKNANE